MRLRSLSEAECYARCYGAHGDERVTVVRVLPRPARSSSDGVERLSGSSGKRAAVQEEAA
jgi:hypothetical protein